MKIKDVDIICPDHKALIERLNSLGSMNLYMINRYQKQKRFYPNSNAGCEDYCLYLGSMEETLKDANGKEYQEQYDLWHYPYYSQSFPSYSTAIIRGNNPGDYMSGWASLAQKRASYKTLLQREVICGLVNEPKIIMELGLASLDLRADMSDVQYNPIINEASGGVDSHTDFDEGDDADYHEADWWVEHWWIDDFENRISD
jgi:hypothetical protein